MVETKLIFVGIEGGATHSTAVAMFGDGLEMARVEGPPTNYWLNGMEESENRIKELVEGCLSKAGVPTGTHVDALGLCLSGCESEDMNDKLREGLQKRFSIFEKSCIFVGSDTAGSLATGCSQGGLILISGTGSNAVLRNPNGGTYQSGGWGHMLGDEGAAYWIASRAVKIIFDEDDNLQEPSHDTTRIRKAIYEHFNIKDRFGMLEHCYQSFKKPFYASLTAGLAQLAKDGDELSLQLMQEAGFALGRFVCALSKNMSDELLKSPEGLQIVCAGSVFKSWDLMKVGFLKGIQPRSNKDKVIPKFSMLRLLVPSSYGAIYEASKQLNYDLPKDHSKNSFVLFSFPENTSSDFGHQEEASPGHKEASPSFTSSIQPVEQTGLQ